MKLIQVEITGCTEIRINSPTQKYISKITSCKPILKCCACNNIAYNITIIETQTGTIFSASVFLELVFLSQLSFHECSYNRTRQL